MDVIETPSSAGQIGGIVDSSPRTDDFGQVAKDLFEIVVEPKAATRARSSRGAA